MIQFSRENRWLLVWRIYRGDGGEELGDRGRACSAASACFAGSHLPVAGLSATLARDGSSLHPSCVPRPRVSVHFEW